MKSKKNSFIPRIHIPTYSSLLLRSFASPLLIYMVLTGNLVLIFSASSFYYWEAALNPQVKDFFSAIWWAFCTITTVGYGDIAPITIGGKITAILCMTFGATFFVCYTAILVSLILKESNLLLIDQEENLSLRLNEIQKKLEHFEKLLKQKIKNDDSTIG